ncbi:GNAT family N-acetyltransferase [Alkaliphilus pronyensis]|uniref:GNAT family N-acetyltransferase n=1 Tax=Alkaliphilus pronyensis TaxID=1482732 RepID=A0A6I0F903_9FIRM|nr:GNAT family N-acetyltransferase [Alkaliphilus pronyensis]KAB3538565.1 GNAT family N-acetyltransferase [Alkaliphilus pronyensis]
MIKYRVVKNRRNEFTNPITVNKNQKVACIEESDDGDWGGWVLCKTEDNEGWIPHQIIKRQGEKGSILEDYCAIEFNLEVGEVLVMEKELNGWIWCYKEGEPKIKAWAPLNHIEKKTQMIETERLILRPIKPLDFNDYCDMLCDDKVYIWLGNRKRRTPEEVEKLMDYFINHLKERGYGVLGVICKETGKLIGHAGANYIKSLDSIEYLYALNSKEWNKGYATEIGRGYLEYFKNNYDYKKLIALAYPQNQRSVNVLKKLGFVNEGRKEMFENMLDYFELSLERVDNPLT